VACPLPDDQRYGHDDQQRHRRGVDPARGAVAQDPGHEEVDRAHDGAEDEQRGEGEGSGAVLGTAADRGGRGNHHITVRVGHPPLGHDSRMP
jgi:hypothetical protein